MRNDRGERATVEGLEGRTFLAATPVSGITATYYDDIDRRGKVVSRVEESIDADFGSEAPAEGIDPTHYFVRWQGRIKAPVTGKYRLSLTHDDKAVLYVDGRRVISGGHDANAGTERHVTVTLRKNRFHSIRLDYTHFNGDAKVQLAWDGPGFPKEVIPDDRYFLPPGTLPPPTQPPTQPDRVTRPANLRVLDKDHDSVTLAWQDSNRTVHIAGFDVLRDGTKVATLGATENRYVDDGLELDTVYRYEVVAFDAAGNRSAPSVVSVQTDAEILPTEGLTGEYYNDLFFSGTPVRRVDPVMNLNFGTRAPAPGIDNTTYSVRWTGEVVAPRSERFTFFVSSDDGVRLQVNGQTLIERFAGIGSQENSASINLVRGQRYDILIEYFNQTGNGYLRLMWSSPSTPRQVVSNLFTDPPVDASLDAPDASATVLSRSSVRVAWDLVTGATGYVVERGRSATGTFQQVFQGGPGATAFTDDRLLSGTDYFYRVRSIAAGGVQSDWSTVLRVTTNT